MGKGAAASIRRGSSRRKGKAIGEGYYVMKETSSRKGGAVGAANAYSSPAVTRILPE